MKKRIAYPIALGLYFVLGMMIGFIPTILICVAFGLKELVFGKPMDNVYRSIDRRRTSSAKLLMTFIISLFALLFWVSPFGMIDVLYDEEKETK